ncbi:hypothetical protein KGM_207761 [Danaus plexippus plexippus]|uniref:Uncharacterized protein n=1 Tax=Danaus plexippus plexippus TaxID=278856 RepID=A0A212EYT5_DANPL|nr:hypothetical protein KGM_207761 [Danaus plexippus plexippus]
MKALHFIAYTFLIKSIICIDFDSYEVNRIEFTPVHDAIIFKDIADIMTEFENNMYTELSTPVMNYSESDEDIEDLLSEYQHYLDKAHKQRLGYTERSKSKNKVPMLRHEKYSKLKPKTQVDDQTNYYFDMKHHANPFFNAMTLPIKTNYDTEVREKTMIDLPQILSKPTYEPASSCHCKVDQIPCKCPCKQCFLTLSETGEFNHRDQKINSTNDKMSLRIKVDVQLPNLSDLINFIKLHSVDRKNSLEWPTPKNILANFNVPFPFAEIPMPIHTFDFRNSFLKDNTPVHKITIHKKKKSRSNNGKKHKGKKLFSFHHENIDPQYHENNTDVINKHNSDNRTVTFNGSVTNTITPSNQSDAFDTIRNISSHNIGNTIPDTKLDSFNTIYLTMNISNNDNNTEESIKIENSIENDYVKYNITTGQPLRLKREIYDFSVRPFKAAFKKLINESQQTNQTFTNKTIESKRTLVAADGLLLYWPNEIKSQPAPTKNITALIMERESKKRKLNITHEAIRSNRTKALEQAIFGDVNWNDVDTVAPVFMSFVGKYIKGILTFCSDIEGHAVYILPWRSINRDIPKIIDFATNGNIKTKYIPKNQFINLKKFLDNSKRESSIRRQEATNASLAVTGIRNFIRDFAATVRPMQIVKILTYCKEGAELYNVVEGRGIGSTLWGWIAYPFTWWYGSTEPAPENDQLIGTVPVTVTKDVEIKPHNVTMCNAQTCSTMTCDSNGCKELVTCNIYDTDLNGDCRTYNTVIPPEEPTTVKSSSTVEKPQDITTSQSSTTAPTTPIPSDNQAIEERPLELEAVLSSTVPEIDKNE